MALRYADIFFSEGTPCSTEFDDVYFSKAGGEAETLHVFINGNDLLSRFKTAHQFCIAETGFGTGLNFCATLSHFVNTAPPSATLDFISFEKFPIDQRELTLIYQNFPSLWAFSTRLIKHYPPLVTGFHLIHFFKERCRLLLFWGEASDGLSELNTCVDAWYLDGFTPSKNPSLWSRALYAQLERLSKPRTTLATFTAASAVRKSLELSGFTLTRSKGFAHKKHMTRGVII